MGITRRIFLQTAASGAAVFPLAAAARRVLGSNEDIRIGVVGLNGRGRNHINGFRRLPGVRVAALCDVDARILQREMQRFTGRGETVTGYADVRRMLHWHIMGRYERSLRFPEDIRNDYLRWSSAYAEFRGIRHCLIKYRVPGRIVRLLVRVKEHILTNGNKKPTHAKPLDANCR